MQSSVLIGLVLCLVAGFCSAAPGPASRAPRIPGPTRIFATLKAGHPRLLADAARFAVIKERIGADRRVSGWYRSAVARGTELLGAPTNEYVIPDGLRLLATSRSVLDRVQLLAFLYRIDGDRKWADRAWKELAAAAAFKDWNPRHFLDTAEMTYAFAIGYDWLYDYLDDGQRATIRSSIIEKGLQPGLKVYRVGGWWSKANHNWNQVCNGGLGMGALAIADEEPVVAGEILVDALRSLPLAMRSYGPDGAWAEGPGYWSYATMYNVAILAGLDSALGTDFGLSKIPGFSLCGLFPIHASGPGLQDFSYADAHVGVIRSPEMWWLAGRFHVPGYAWYAAESRADGVLSMLWYEPGMDTGRPRGLPTGAYFRGAEVATSRSAWARPDALWLAIKAGDNNANHSHLDLGSFVLEGDGVRWALDIGSDEYNMPGYFGLQRFTYYRLRAEGHNTMVYGSPAGAGPDQQPRAIARITRFEHTTRRTTALVDLSAAYKPLVNEATREFTRLGSRQVIIRDRMKAESPTEAWWFLHTAADITLSDDGREATLAQEGKQLVARIAAGSPGRFEVLDARPLLGAQDPSMQQKNAGIRKLAIRLANVTTVDLAVELLMPGEREGNKH